MGECEFYVDSMVSDQKEDIECLHHRRYYCSLFLDGIRDISSIEMNVFLKGLRQQRARVPFPLLGSVPSIRISSGPTTVVTEFR